MTLLFSRFRNKQILFFMAAMLAIAVYLSFQGLYIVASVVGAVAVIGFFLPLANVCDGIFNDAFVKQLRNIVQKAGDGHLSERITNIDMTHALSGVAWSFNDLLDQVEQIMRDIQDSLQEASTGNENRILFSQGYKGDFAALCPSLNNAIETVAASYKGRVVGRLTLDFEKAGGGVAKSLEIIQDNIL